MNKIQTACIVFLLLVTGCNSYGIGSSSDLQSQATDLVHELTSGDIAAVRSRFAPFLSNALSETQLRQAWSDLIVSNGAMQEVAKVHEAREGSYQVVYVTGRFDRGFVNVKVVFQGNRVAGLFFIPVVMWKSPAYADSQQFTEQPISVKTGKFVLPGTLTIPKNGKDWPGVVLVHGSGPNDQDETIGPNKIFKDIAWGLASRGIAVVRYDKRTLKYGPKAARNPLKMTVEQETVEDAVSALKFLSQVDGIDPKHLCVLGHSLGGMLAPRIAAASDHKPSGLIIFAGNARPLDALLLEQITCLAKMDGTVDDTEQRLIDATLVAVKRLDSPDCGSSEILDLAGSKIPAGYLLDLRKYNPIALAQQLRIPVFALRGGRDYQITETDQQMWRESVQDIQGSRCRTYESLNHLFMEGKGLSNPEEYLREGHVAEEVVEDIAKWIKGEQ